MANEWIVDVLVDLQAFAQRNGLPALDQTLTDTITVAKGELASAQGMMPPSGRLDRDHAGSLHRATAQGRQF